MLNAWMFLIESTGIYGMWEMRSKIATCNKIFKGSTKY